MIPELTDMTEAGAASSLAETAFSTQPPVKPKLNSDVTEDEADDIWDDLPPVIEFPIVKTVRVTLREVGRLEPMPFPDMDD
jgi:hypothetical protein